MNAAKRKSADVVYTHDDLDAIQERIDAEPYFRCGAPPCKRPSWVDMPVVLEVPLGELVDPDGLGLGGLVAVQRGFDSVKVETSAIDGSEQFAAQGLEGKARIHTTFFDAFLKLRDYCKPHRARIVA